MAHFKLSLTLIGAAALLAACGGSDSPRGKLIDPPAVLATLPKSLLDTNAASLRQIGVTTLARCDVKVVALNYYTPGVRGETSNSSGVMLVPTGEGCTGPAPLVAYAKGTDVQKPRTLANPTDSETFLLAAIYAAQGYAVVATDYLGFAKSACPRSVVQ